MTLNELRRQPRADTRPLDAELRCVGGCSVITRKEPAPAVGLL